MADLVSTIDLVDFMYKDHRRETVMQPLSEADEIAALRHQFLRLGLVNGEQYAIDICGAQFGEYDPCTPLAEYEKAHCGHTISVAKYDLPKSQFEIDSYGIQYSFQAQLSLIGAQIPGQHSWSVFTKLMNAAIQEWQYKEQMALRSLWKTPKEMFQKLQENLVDFVEMALQGKEDLVDPEDYGTARGPALKARKAEIVQKLS